MTEEILSVGIDIGTTTSQVIFSKLTLENSSFTAVPEVSIKDKEIIYRSDVHFTPLTMDDTIDIPAIEALIDAEYAKAGVRREDIGTGAIIITGESSRKENARRAVMGLSRHAGDFVVASAGPDLESVLAGYGAGAGDYSKHTAKPVVNFDIGGGTTNASVFVDNTIEDFFALDIGGRLLRVDEMNRLTYVSERIKPLIQELGLNIVVGQDADVATLCELTDAFAQVLLKICDQAPLSDAEAQLYINHKDKGQVIDAVMFSGGVAECIYDEGDAPLTLDDLQRYGDIGPFVGRSVAKAFSKAPHIQLLVPNEKIRATVIGAGSYSVRLSGTTVLANDDLAPLKNIPVIAIDHVDDTQRLKAELLLKERMYEPGQQLAVALSCETVNDYVSMKKVAKALAEGGKDLGPVLLVIVREDYAKALGLLLQKYSNGQPVICLDRINVAQGDYVDIGKSVAGIVPVVVKTLIFQS
ncbi:MAG: ethanolamine ammonia-lyase reactivating factor EutA [Veillonella sp.]|nr:ethanolamine ammonia-lyase reactivating factor EutA [Veillonella sp.]